MAFALQRLTAQRHPRPLRHRLRHFARHLSPAPPRWISGPIAMSSRVAGSPNWTAFIASMRQRKAVGFLLNIDPLDAVTHLPG